MFHLIQVFPFEQAENHFFGCGTVCLEVLPMNDYLDQHLLNIMLD